MISEIWKKSNIITFIGIIISILSIFFCYNNMQNYAIIMLILAGICDAFDGPIARRINKSPNSYGIQLDSLADIISSGIVPICIGLSMRI